MRMLKKCIMILFLFPAALMLTGEIHALESTIVEVEGESCIGDDKTLNDAKKEALAHAKRVAAETAVTYIQSQSVVKDMELQKDLVTAIASGFVKILQTLESKKYLAEFSGLCYKVKIRAEVIPDEKKMETLANNKGFTDDPASPLKVVLWTSKKEYKEGENLRIYLKGNKPFFARLVYVDVDGNPLQVFPNVVRSDNYFRGGVVYEIPSQDGRKDKNGGKKNFKIEVGCKCGKEKIIVYASTSQLGNLKLTPIQDFYLIKDNDIGSMSRKIILAVDDSKKGAKIPAEFSESEISVLTKK